MYSKITLEKYSERYHKGVCPKCGSSDVIVKRSDDFIDIYPNGYPLGCRACKWGFFEQYLPDESLKKYHEEHNEKFNIQYYTNKRAIELFSKKKNKIYNNTDATQLSLF